MDVTSDYIVYLLVHSIHNKTYLGITNNSERRLRQHNCDLKGGARYTTGFKGEGEWSYYICISNLTKRESLSIERTAKNKRRRAKGSSPLEKRLDVLLPLLEKYPDCVVEYKDKTKV
jgi:predicted GIY-YIG superfamily endonuclease